jgi:dihydroxyacid dehydratase/phosphogluconate dehydratase
VDDATIARRKAAWRPYEREVPHGFMRRYRKHVRPACDGAVLD